MNIYNTCSCQQRNENLPNLNKEWISNNENQSHQTKQVNRNIILNGKKSLKTLYTMKLFT